LDRPDIAEPHSEMRGNRKRGVTRSIEIKHECHPMMKVVGSRVKKQINEATHNYVSSQLHAVAELNFVQPTITHHCGNGFFLIEHNRSKTAD
jgi:hypothetical protein